MLPWAKEEEKKGRRKVEKIAKRREQKKVEIDSLW